MEGPARVEPVAASAAMVAKGASPAKGEGEEHRVAMVERWVAAEEKGAIVASQ